MHPMLFVVAAGLVATFIYFAVGAWRMFRREIPVPPQRERLSIGIIFGLVGWQAVGWLRGEHPDAATVRWVGVWLQLLCAFGIATLMIVVGRFATPTITTK